MPATKTRKPKFKRLPKGPNGGIQLLLIQSVEHLGQQGEVVEKSLDVEVGLKPYADQAPTKLD